MRGHSQPPSGVFVPAHSDPIGRTDMTIVELKESVLEDNDTEMLTEFREAISKYL